MEKRLPLFLFLAFLILFAWRMIFPPPPDPGDLPLPPPAAGATPDAGAIVAPAAKEPAALADEMERTLELFVGGAREAGAPGRRGAYRAVFTNRGARLLELDFADYHRAVGLTEEQKRDTANWLPLVESVETADGKTGSLLLRTRDSLAELVPGGLADVLWTMEELAAPDSGVRFRYSPPGGKLELEKRIAFRPGTWDIDVSLTIRNVSAGPGRAHVLELVPASVTPAELGDRFYSEPNAIAIGRGRESDSVSAPSADEPGALEAPTPLEVVGLHNKYFAFLLREGANTAGTIGGATYAPVREVGLAPRPLLEVEALVTLGIPAEGEERSFEYVVYAGPKDPDVFVADAAAHQVVVDEDLTVDSIAKALLYVLRLLHGLVGNWGVAIILLTLCVRIVLFPLNRRSQTAMARYQKKMKRVQPRLEDAKKRFAGDPQKLREAQARIMQEEGAFPPLGGCLPIFLQMPVFFGLFSALRVSFDLRQAPFYGWIHDLSRPDELLHLGLELPLLPDIQYLNVLPILMVVLWVLQQMGMPKPADEQAARMQKMMMFMPVVFGLMLYNYAAGLSLYMMTTSALSIVEQKVIKKLWPPDDTEPEPKANKGCGPFSGMMQHLAEKQREQMKRVQAMQEEKRRQERKRKK